MPALNSTVILLLFFIACIYTLSLFLYSSILDYLLNPITIFFETIEKLGHGHCTYRGVTGYQILGGQSVMWRAAAGRRLLLFCQKLGGQLPTHQLRPWVKHCWYRVGWVNFSPILSSVNLIPTKWGRLCPPHYCSPTQLWKPNDISVK